MNREPRFPTAEDPSGAPSLPWWAAPLVIPGCLLAIVLSVPFAVVMMGLQSAGEWRFRRRMRRAGRFIEWRDLVRSLEAGEGTLIVEQAQKCPARIWWTPDGVCERAPCPPPDIEALERLAFGFGHPHEFVAWCHAQYTDEKGGGGVLTDPRLKLPPGLFFREFFRDLYPRLSVIDTVYCRAARRAATDEPPSPS